MPKLYWKLFSVQQNYIENNVQYSFGIFTTFLKTCCQICSLFSGMAFFTLVQLLCFNTRAQ